MNADVNVFVSALSSIRDGSFNVASKLNFLWYDRIIFEDLGRIDHVKKITEADSIRPSDSLFLRDRIVPLSRIENGEIKKKRMEFYFEGYPRWEENGDLRYNYPEPENPHQFAHNTMLKHYENRAGVARFEDGYIVEQVEGAAKVAVDALRSWALINERLPCSIACSEDEKLAMDAMLQFAAKKSTSRSESDIVRHLGEIIVPDLSNIPWADIIAMKRSGEFLALREKIRELYRLHNDYDLAAREFSLEAKNLSRKIIVKSKPRPIRALFDLIATNIPSGLFNPYSIFVGYKKLVDDCRELSNHQWIYSLAKLQDIVEEHAR